MVSQWLSDETRRRTSITGEKPDMHFIVSQWLSDSPDGCRTAEAAVAAAAAVCSGGDDGRGGRGGGGQGAGAAQGDPAHRARWD
eukprot:457738-Prorocentrum_minimum.AAC.1